MLNKRWIFPLLSLALLIAFPACDDVDGEEEDVRESLNDHCNENLPDCGASYVYTEAKAASTQFISRLEMPRLQAGDIFIVHQSTDMTGNPVNYSVAYSPENHHSRWVAFRFDNAMREKQVARKDYSIRPQYPKDPLCTVTTSNDASFSGYDHGHLCASADRLCSRLSNDQTFYMSNMSPQMGDFNQSYWTKYESFVQTLGRNCLSVTDSKRWADTLYVVKGGTIDPQQVLTYITVDKNRMPVPKYYFIALLKVKNNTYSSIAFWVEHRDYDTKKILKDEDEVFAHAISVDELERRTGIDFFCNLPGVVEKSVESVYMTSAWKN